MPRGIPNKRLEVETASPKKETLISQHYVTLHLRANHSIKDKILPNVQLFDMNIKATNFDGSELDNCNFEKISFEGSDFLKAVVVGCTFKNCDMRYIVCTRDFLKDNIFEKCDMRSTHAS